MGRERERDGRRMQRPKAEREKGVDTLKMSFADRGRVMACGIDPIGLECKGRRPKGSYRKENFDNLGLLLLGSALDVNLALTLSLTTALTAFFGFF